MTIRRPLCHIKEGTDLLESKGVITTSALKMKNLEQQITIKRHFVDTT